MKKMDFQKVVEWLSFALRCPVCNYKYNLERTKIIDTKQGSEDDSQATLVVHSDCAQCKSSVVFSISIDGPDIFTISMVTDLTQDDITKFSSFKPLTSNDCLSVHKFFRGFDGDLVKALKTP